MLSEMPTMSTDMGYNINHLFGSSMGEPSQPLMSTIQTFHENGNGFPVDQIDYGYGSTSGLAPPESWEALFTNEPEPNWMDPQILSSDSQFPALTPRMQESAERGQISSASGGLILRLSVEFPVSVFSILSKKGFPDVLGFPIRSKLCHHFA
jgi:hypothetical protein